LHLLTSGEIVEFTATRIQCAASDNDERAGARVRPKWEVRAKPEADDVFVLQVLGSISAAVAMG
jgi:hypothetical protein